MSSLEAYHAQMAEVLVALSEKGRGLRAPNLFFGAVATAIPEPGTDKPPSVLISSAQQVPVGEPSVYALCHVVLGASILGRLVEDTKRVCREESWSPEKMLRLMLTFAAARDEIMDAHFQSHFVNLKDLPDGP